VEEVDVTTRMKTNSEAVRLILARIEFSLCKRRKQFSRHLSASRRVRYERLVTVFNNSVENSVEKAAA